MNFFWIFIALGGALVVIMDAMSEHILKGIMQVEDITRIQTAITYQMYHTLMIAILAMYSQRVSFKSRSIDQSIWIFIAGIVLFSGSLYLYTFTKLQGFFFIT
ncbi:protein of unknown function DUF423 [Candidatus Ruthia magnifica str. Cm (Calyptogena magnifica)]|uniref:Uncharacterized protein n=1 Tax=Ruthia magnifica subsp. Calyptogena magnifica TaxID=413404 RepID=A1AWN4_RUTMC|nr:DUF423 domain-containing protein [Candidatus Ruthturnera calyptogenae]ABL02341.1 protein of unknown function DUF423 [Candidatus Ruthia magnifica str. Cm (Calyptogena magnifica)]